MKIAGIICEYNPLHAGHQWQMAEIRRRLGSNCLIINVLSGHFVQRGEPACLDKYTRAQLAIRSGADLVLELPFHFSCAAAGHFAKASVQLLQSLGLHMQLCFGSEIEDRQLLHDLSSILQDETDEFKSILQRQLSLGQGFASARSEALTSVFLRKQNEWLSSKIESNKIDPNKIDPNKIESKCASHGHGHGQDDRQDPKQRKRYTENEIKAILRQPNVILALEYMAQIKRCQALDKKANFLTPFILPRLGHADHDQSLPALNNNSDFQTENQWLSASAIRSVCASFHSPSGVIEKLSGQVPDFVLGEMAQALRQDCYYQCEDLSLQLLHAIHTLPLSTLQSMDGLGNGLAERLKRCLLRHGSNICSWNDLLRFASSKSFTQTRIQRAFSSILLQISLDEAVEMRRVGPQYIRPLAASKDGKYLLGKLRKTASLPLINKASDFLEHKQNHALFIQGMTELRAGDCLQIAHHRGVGQEFRKIPLMIARKKRRRMSDI